MNDTLKLIETRTINDALVNGYYGKKEAWFTLLSKEIKKYEKWYTAFKARKVDYSL